MTVSTGLNSHFAWGIQTAQGTRVAPDVSYPIDSETFAETGLQPSRRSGIVKGRRGAHALTYSKGNITGGFVADLTTDTIGEMLFCALGSVATTGAGPYEHVITRNPSALPYWSAQVAWEDNAATDFRKDYTDLQTNSLALSVATGSDPKLTVATLGGVEEIDAYPAVVPAYGTMNYLLFSDLTITPDGGSAMCWNGLDLTCTNNLTASQATCATNPRATIYRDTGVFDVTGTLTREFDGSFADYTKFINGTEATLAALFTSANGDTLQIDTRIVYTGQTPQVGGPDTIMHNLPFMGVSATSDADIVKFTLSNSDTVVDGSV